MCTLAVERKTVPPMDCVYLQRCASHYLESISHLNTSKAKFMKIEYGFSAHQIAVAETALHRSQLWVSYLSSTKTL